MRVYNVWEEDDEERKGLMEGLRAKQLRAQREEKQVSTINFTQGIAHPPKKEQNTINRINTKMQEITKTYIQEISHLKSYHPVNNTHNIESTSKEERTDEEPKSAVLLIETPMTQRQISRKAFLQRIARRDEYQKRRQDQRKEYRAKFKKSIISHTMAQIKYLDDVDIEQFQKEKEAMKEIQARQSQGSFMQAIRQMFNFSKQDKKLTQ